ncbi:MAG: hypothetical protein EBV06_16010 [Planctomycetia bacterium]|nr:hypothetical protein [Planctomycetia bacterium]
MARTPHIRAAPAASCVVLYGSGLVFFAACVVFSFCFLSAYCVFVLQFRCSLAFSCFWLVELFLFAIFVILSAFGFLPFSSCRFFGSVLASVFLVIILRFAMLWLLLCLLCSVHVCRLLAHILLVLLCFCLVALLVLFFRLAAIFFLVFLFCSFCFGVLAVLFLRCSCGSAVF